MLKRDFSAPTLEDHFNKTVLPKVMQVLFASHVCVSSDIVLRQSVIISYHKFSFMIIDPSVLWHCWPHVALVRIEPLYFLSGCRKRWLNQALSVFSLSIGFSSVLLFVRSPFRVFAHLIAPVVTTIYITLSSNKIQNGDILELANPDPPGKWLLKRRDITVFVATFALWPYSALELDDQD